MTMLIVLCILKIAKIVKRTFIQHFTYTETKEMMKLDNVRFNKDQNICHVLEMLSMFLIIVKQTKY